MNEIIGLLLSNFAFLIGLIGAGQKKIQILRLIGIIEYTSFGIWTYLFVSYEQKIPVVIWCVCYIIVYLFRFVIELLKHQIPEESNKI